GAARNAAANPQVIELCRMRAHTGLEVAQALAVGELRQGHRQELVAAREVLDVTIAVVLEHKPLESLPRQELHQLSEHEFAGAHGRSPRSRNLEIRPWSSSNRGHSGNATSQSPINDLQFMSVSFTGHYWVRPQFPLAARRPGIGVCPRFSLGTPFAPSRRHHSKGRSWNTPRRTRSRAAWKRSRARPRSACATCARRWSST